MLSPYAGVRIIESWHMVDRHEDWSRVRSPSRAIRRLRRGYRQNIVITETPKKVAISADGGKTLVMHPVMADALRRASTPTKQTIADAVCFGWRKP